MILKIAGSAAVLLACAGFGFFAASEVERRERQLRMLYASFLLIQGDIRYRRSSLPEAFLMAVKKEGDFAVFF
nr:stage III sporulation protein AB [Lachnospiraceae bacterium]